MVFEVLVLSALILTTRCANYRDVFLAGNIYFVDADCYSRMTRVRLCAQHPGLVLRHHDFENFPKGTNPHTTAPLDYTILIFSLFLRPFTTRSIELAGAFISPLCALIGGLFLWWWSQKMRFRFRWAMLILFALSPILVHGTELGRPDHQSLALVLVIVAICCDWALLSSELAGWKLVSGLAWGLAIWVSAYEPLLLVLVSTVGARMSRVDRRIPDRSKRTDYLSIWTNNLYLGTASRYLKWFALGTVLVVALVVERRFPSLPAFAGYPIFLNWSRSIGELAQIPLLSSIWFNWLGWLIIAAPVLWVFGRRNDSGRIPLTMVILLVATFLLTLWQARWGYFLAAIFAIVLPLLLGRIRSGVLAWTLFICSLWPILRDWDSRIWPDPLTAARQVEQRHEAIGLREVSLNMISTELRPFLAPWWLSPAIAYWSGQPGIAGSSHESLPGIADSARFFLTDDVATAGEILRQRQVAWVISYDAERVERNSSAILGQKAPENSLARVLDQRPAQAPGFLALSTQTGSEKLFQVTNKW